MGHALIDEFCRAHSLAPEFFRRCQRVFRDEVQPMLDELEALRAEKASHVSALPSPPIGFQYDHGVSRAPSPLSPDVPLKRGRGRPRKVRPEVEVPA